MSDGRSASKFVVSVVRDSKNNLSVPKRKRNFWNDSYKCSLDKESVVDLFCADFAYTIGDMAEKKVPQEDMLSGISKWANLASHSFSVSNVDFKEGWKLHKDWFKCMLSQLYLQGAEEREGLEYQHFYNNVRGLFSELGWNFENAIKPKYDNVTTVYDIAYKYVDKGKEEKRFYRVILEPSVEFPVNAVYESSTGKKWEVLGASELEVELIAEDMDKNGNYPTLKMQPNMVHKMKRIL